MLGGDGMRMFSMATSTMSRKAGVEQIWRRCEVHFVVNRMFDLYECGSRVSRSGLSGWFDRGRDHGAFWDGGGGAPVARVWSALEGPGDLLRGRQKLLNAWMGNTPSVFGDNPCQDGTMGIG
jgi:hypothetical protein